MRMICKSLRVGVSRLVKSRICSSTSGARSCASSITSTRALTASVRGEQMLVQRVDEQLAARRGSRIGDAQLVAQRGQELDVRELRVQDERHVHARRQLLEQAAAERRLAGADLPRELHETTTFTDPVEQVRERLTVRPAHVEIARVGRDRKRGLDETEIGGVHRPSEAEPRTVHARPAPDAGGRSRRAPREPAAARDGDRRLDEHPRRSTWQLGGAPPGRAVARRGRSCSVRSCRRK